MALTINPARLKAILLNTGLQQKDNPLYQFLNALLTDLVNVANVANSVTGGGGGSTTINNIQNTIQQLLMNGDSDSSEGLDVIPGPPGVAGIDGITGIVPYYIAPTETYVVPEFKQALFAMNIDNEGILEIDGFLIEVDGIPSSVVGSSNPIVIYPENGQDGLDGFPGARGADGASGIQGVAGISGFDGVDGLDGLLGFVPSLAGGYIDVSTTGNIDNLDFGNVPLIRMTNATLATIRGLKAGYPGQRVTIISTNAQVDLANQNAGSTTEFRLINKVTSANSSLAAGVGSCSYVYDIVTLRWRLDSHIQGAFINQPFNAGDFTGAGALTWTVGVGNISTFAYYLNGKELTVILAEGGGTTGGTPNLYLNSVIPGGFSSSSPTAGLYRYSENGVAAAGTYFAAINSSTQISYYKLDTAINWLVAGTVVNMSVNFSFPVT